jgi:hypothetical protein
MQCASCRQPLLPNSSWRDSSGQFFCSEFCAETPAKTPTRYEVQKDRIDREYLNRLKRLLVLRRCA